MKRKEKVNKTEEVYEINPAELELHPLAQTTPRMTDANYTALKADIEENGQLDPITLYRGRIIDGRHRWLILQELGIDVILAVKLSPTTSADKLKSLVRSKETRRHETPTQLAISAYKMMLESATKLTAQAAANITGADRRKVGNAKQIADTYGRMDILNTLFDGEMIDIGTAYAPYKTDSLPAILDWLKESKKQGKLKDVRGKVEMTEEQFAECAVRIAELKGLDIKQIKHISSKLFGHVKEYEEMMSEKTEGSK